MQPWLALLLTVGLAAQAPFDLRAIAADLLGDGTMPPVLAAIPADVQQELAELTALLTPAERETLWRSAPIGYRDTALGRAQLGLAVTTLAEPDTAATRDACWRQFWSCLIVWQAGDLRAKSERLLGTETRSWSSAIAPAALARAKVLAARFLQQFPDDAEVGSVLWAMVPHGSAAVTAALASEAERRLDQRPLARQLIDRGWLRLKSGDLDAAAAAVEQALAEPRHELHEVQDRLFDDAAAIRQRIAEARRWLTPAGSGLATEMAALRFLRATDTKAALAASQKRVDEGVAHALPATLLAAAALSNGDREAVSRHLRQALASPGKDGLTAMLVLLHEVMPEAAKRRRSASESEVLLERMAELLKPCDEMMAEEDSEVATVFRGLRDMGWPFEREGTALLESLDEVLELWQRVPNSKTANHLLHASAIVAKDRAGARAALAKPLPTGLRTSTELVRRRVEVAVAMALESGDHGLVAEPLQMLESVPEGSRDAHYMRGLLAWSAGPEQRTTAREHFLAARRLPFERGAWPVAVALFVSDPEAPLVELERVRRLAGAPGLAMVPFVLAQLQRTPDASTLALASSLVGRTGSTVADLLLNSALAVSYAEAGDHAASRRAAMQVLATELESVSDRAAVLAAARGVCVQRQLNWNMGASAQGPDLRVEFSCELYAMVPLPSRARLRQLVRD